MANPDRVLTPRVVVLVLLFVVLVPFLPLVISRRWGWWEAWVYAIATILGFAVSRWLAGRRNPDLLRERARFMRHDDAEPWDRVLAPLVGLGGALIPLVAGLDALFDRSPAFPLPAKLLSFAVIAAGYSLGSWALIENRYFSGMVRLQVDRDQRVIATGPYRWLRHPGYSGALLTYLATPVFLDAAWAFVPVALLAALLVIRTALEDRTLQSKLAGYREYAGRVRCRLLPGIW
ncbi:MAG: isoprenylcysteine carboxylmethyltransferase family protein [Deltaproteobacteria bacterium]|nr:isoprenylcysteine carboxylmethyltransferase family protein [Deltaproteobacteria bacterium]